MASESWPLVDRVPSLGPQDVHVWQTCLDCDGTTVERLESTLSPAEIERANRFHQPRDRRRFVVARGSLRRFLGEYLALEPTAVKLTATTLGKPHLADERLSFRFNVAHSDELALFAFADGREVGVDVEEERADFNWQELAQRYFTPEEFTALLSAIDSPNAFFFRCWTLKEAYVKALGQGMQLPLDRFAVTITGESVGLLHTAHDPEQLPRWTLRSLSPAAGFAAALAVEGSDWRLFRARHAGFP